MHIKKMIEDIVKSNDVDKMNKLSYILADLVYDLKESDYEEYKEVELELHVLAYGYHFNETLYKKACEHMKNEDGSTGGHWNLSDTNAVARQYGIDYTHINEYDWGYTLNMMYSDYYGAVPNDLGTYVKMTKAFLFDKDAKEGKVLRYYLSISK